MSCSRTQLDASAIRSHDASIHCPTTNVDTSMSPSSLEPRHEKTNNVVFEQLRHKQGCSSTEDGKRLEILDLGRRGIVLSE